MSEYDFRSLSPGDFERLVRDVLNVDLGLRLYAFPEGKDGGTDLREVGDDGLVTVVQCKHYIDSSPSDFDRAIKKEKTKPALGEADTYILATSHRLSPAREKKTANELGIDLANVWGPGRINRVLADHTEIEERHFKLWLGSATVLTHLLNAGLWERTDARVDEVRQRARYWVDVPSYVKAREVVEREGVCILSGLSGVGKTYLADRLMLDALHEEWRVVDLAGDLTEAWSAARGPGKLLFYFDDFLGQAELRLDAVDAATDLLNFINYIGKNKTHKRLVMTTRTQVLTQAEQANSDRLYELVNDRPGRIVVVSVPDVGFRVEILKNHLHFSDLPRPELDTLEVDTRLKALALSPSFNPRLMQLVTSSSLREESADSVLRALSDAFANPVSAWRTTFGALSDLARELLLTLATFPERATLISDLKRVTSPPAPAVSWKQALKSLEPTWIKVVGEASDRSVAFANPGCRDFLLDEIDDYELAEERVTVRLNRLEQLISLTQSAGLLTAGPATQPSVLRPNLKAVLLDKKATLASRIQGLWEDWTGRVCRTSSSTLFRLCDTAALLDLYAEPQEFGWLFDVASSLTGTLGVSPMDCSSALRLARQLRQMVPPGEAKRDAVVRTLVLAAVRQARTIRDLDSYEHLPELMRTDEVRVVATERARHILQDEVQQAEHDGYGVSALRDVVSELERRADWYGVELDVALLIDRIDELSSYS